MRQLDTAAAALREHWHLAVVLDLFVLAALIVPTLAPVPVSDDWVYARSVEILVREGRLHILGLSVVTLVFQVLWGALFAWLFGLSFGTLRLATVVLVFLSGVAFYALCRELGISRARSALGTAAYLFNPLAFVLSFTFMSDPYFTALLVIATFLYVRGLRTGAEGERATLLGSLVAACAFLVRQQGVLIPFAVVLYLVVSRRLRPSREGIARFARVVALPAGVTALYYLWLRFIHGIPYRQQDFLASITEAGWSGARELAQRLTFIELMYVGLFALPLAAAALIGVRRLLSFTAPLGWLLFCAWETTVVAGLVAFSNEGRRMPYVDQFLQPHGLGPSDQLGARPWLADIEVIDRLTSLWLTGICAASSLVLALILCRKVGAGPTPGRAQAGLILAVGLWQAVGVLPPSFGFRTWGGSLDRYLLPILPFAICLGLWALRDVRLALPVAWLVVAAFAVYAVAGTRDFLVYQQATWDLARYANSLGIPNTRLDAGAAWDGYHLYEQSLADWHPRTPDPRPWWTGLFAPLTDSSYAVAASPVPGYSVVTRVEYSSWLQRNPPVYLYLLRRLDVPGPP